MYRPYDKHKTIKTHMVTIKDLDIVPPRTLTFDHPELCIL